jgi:hypothetical protein
MVICCFLCQKACLCALSFALCLLWVSVGGSFRLDSVLCLLKLCCLLVVFLFVVYAFSSLIFLFFFVLTISAHCSVFIMCPLYPLWIWCVCVCIMIPF